MRTGTWRTGLAAVTLAALGAAAATGRASDAESRTASMAGGGTLTYRVAGESLLVTVTGPANGLATICVGDSQHVSVLHASAALGTAEYRRTEAGWTLTTPFAWKVRDSPRNGPAPAAERDAFLAEAGWLANSSAAGTPVREFVILRRAGRARFAVAFLATDDMQLSYWPPSVDDSVRNVDLSRGPAPGGAEFRVATWCPLE